MNHTLLIQSAELHALQLAGADLLVCDCSFDLTDPAAGALAHAAFHLPGAVHLHLDADLSGAKTGFNGRHPLPDRERLAARLSSLGASDTTQIVAYDRSGGMVAVRLWWLLRWLGHRAVAVLDGGLAAWTAAGYRLEEGPPPERWPGRFTVRAPLVQTLDHAALRANLDSAERLVVDARAPDRFRGENETLDAVGGHIPGAVNRFFKDNLQADGRFKPAAQLKAEFDTVTGGKAGAALVLQCGSGVTACHNLLALELAGLPGAALYPGSWSEWSSQPGAPIATGSD